MITIEGIARVCHETNKAYCDVIGDTSQKHWEDAEQWQRDSAVNGVKFAIENPDASPIDQHVSWMNDKVEDGWVYGEVKDSVLKTHPCLVSYSKLPIEQRLKDTLFMHVVHSMKYGL